MPPRRPAPRSDRSDWSETPSPNQELYFDMGFDMDWDIARRVAQMAIARPHFFSSFSILHGHGPPPHVSFSYTCLSILPTRTACSGGLFNMQPVYRKIFYLVRMIVILNTDSTIVFYVTRRTKLDPSCIYFKNIFTQQQLM